MKKLYTLLLLLATSMTVATAQTHTVEGDLIMRTANNADVKLYFPVVKDGPGADKLNAQIMNIYNDLNPVKETVTPVDKVTLEQMVDESIDYAAQKGLTKSIEELPYTHFASWSYAENDFLISIIIAQFIDMGDPRPQIQMNVININKITGEMFNIHDLIARPEHISELAAKQFRKDHKFPENVLRLRTGLSYELADLPLAKTIGITKKGLSMFYVRGEIAPSNFPLIIISVPFSAIDNNVYPDGFEKNKFYMQGGVKEVEKLVFSYLDEQGEVGKHKKY